MGSPWVSVGFSISIHALREEGDLIVNGFCDDLRISIHALREEGDPKSCTDYTAWGIFLSTPSARRATVETGVSYNAQIISIHALREEGDRSECPKEKS